CPVLVVRPQAPNRPAGPLKIILAYDDSPGSKVAAKQLFSFPWAADTQIQITTLLERPHLLHKDEVYDPQAIADGERKLTELVAEAHCSANVHYLVRETIHVGDALAHLADEAHGDLMFVGETGRSALARFFVGSAAKHILHHSASSVWIARGKQWN
ncbi:MAG: universal stress protein, partial [Planctomycetales bacterium]|nr:universal stress protein [Planctomycetales bacterium]